MFLSNKLYHGSKYPTNWSKTAEKLFERTLLRSCLIYFHCLFLIAQIFRETRAFQNAYQQLREPDSISFIVVSPEKIRQSRFSS